MNFLDLPTLFQQNKFIFIVFGLVIIGTFVFNIIRMTRIKQSGNNFIMEHPDASKVYLSVKAFITSEMVSVHTVDGDTPVFFMEKTKSGFYLIPGNRTVEMSYTYSRPGVLHKNVTQTYGPCKKELIITANKNYLLGFDRETETFTFNEI